MNVELLSCSLKEEHKLRVFETDVVRGIFQPKRDEVTKNGGSYLIRNFLFCILCSTAKVVKSRLCWAERVA
jgi:hypothetical protein